jgi:hypothetical protein
VGSGTVAAVTVAFASTKNEVNDKVTQLCLNYFALSCCIDFKSY